MDDGPRAGEVFAGLVAIGAVSFVGALVVKRLDDLRQLYYFLVRPRFRERVLEQLVWRIPGEANARVFSGNFKNRELPVEIVEHRLGEASYRIELASPLGLVLPGEVVIPDVATVERLARDALEKAGENPQLATLGETLLSGETDWRALFVVFGVGQVVFTRSSVKVSARFGEGLSAPDEAERLERLLERLASVSTILGKILAVREKASGEARCPYCHDGFAESAPVAACTACGARHHEDCLAEHGKCAVFGCSAPRPRVAEPNRSP